MLRDPSFTDMTSIRPAEFGLENWKTGQLGAGQELEERNFETGWEGEAGPWWYCQVTCAKQTSNISKFRHCMELCHEDPKTKALAEEFMKELAEDKARAEAL